MGSGKISGVITALITPFFEGEIDWNSLESLLVDQIDQGISGFVINGTTAESPNLSEQEVDEIFAFCKRVSLEKKFNGPLILGTGSNSTAKTVELNKKAEQMGADATLVVVPYYNKPPQRGLVAHFETVASQANLPILLYNVPGRTIASLSIESIVELARHPNIIGIKEASGDLQIVKKLIDQIDTQFSLLSGDDETCFRFMAEGGDGVISVCSHLIGREMQELLIKNGSNWGAAIESFDRYLPLVKSLYLESNPIPVKHALFQMGLIRSDELRLPLVSMVEALAYQLKQEMLKSGLIHEA